MDIIFVFHSFSLSLHTKREIKDNEKTQKLICTNIMWQYFFRLLGFALDAIIVITMVYQGWRLISIFRKGRDKHVLFLNLFLFIICICIGAYIIYKNII